jgi:hypothetical protein
VEITVEVLDKHIEEFKKQHQSLTVQVHTLSGAIQILQLLKKQLTDAPTDS